ncbi:class II fructose-bisphosphate aldolase [Streptomyces sp. M19]
MPLITTAELVDRAVADGTAAAAFNVITLEHAEAIAAAAERTGLPAILAVSHNAVRYHGGALGPLSAACAAVARGSDAELALHLDHVEDLALVELAADHGYSSVMFDASRLPHEENVAATARAAALLHPRACGWRPSWARSAARTGALGHGPYGPGGRRALRGGHRRGRLAVAVGSSHAMTERTAALDHALIERLRDAVPVPLVLHGSSGVPDEAITRAVASGMRKINVGTQLNIAFTGAVRERLAADDRVDPRRWLAPARDAVTATVAELLPVITARPTA